MNGKFPQYSDAMRSASHAIWRTVDTFSVQQQVEIKLSRKSYCRASCKDYLHTVAFWSKLLFNMRTQLCSTNQYLFFLISLLNSVKLVVQLSCWFKCGIIVREGYRCEEHSVITEDGYILRLQRIPNDGHRSGKKLPVVLQHGLLQSASDWVLNSRNHSLGFILADAGFDVWLSNVRGNVYSRRHVSLHPKSQEFWAFTIDQMANYDLPAIINFVLNETSAPSLHYAGHSQGTTIGFILFSERPTWSAAKHMTSLGENVSCFCTGCLPGQHKKRPEACRSVQLPMVEMVGGYEFMPSTRFMKWLGGKLCTGRTAFLCQNALFLFVGCDFLNFNMTRLPVYMAHTPSGTSVSNIMHFSQMIQKGEFKKFDYGSDENTKIYNQPESPKYKVGNMLVPVVLYWGGNDVFTVESDIMRLSAELKSTLSIHYYHDSDHVDFVWGTNMADGAYRRMLESIDIYEN
ncbi:Gastric triacylglycerol lipase [Trichinella spiralis]|uniref:Gastric triacylglycerol lipase n=1 Tax=Trichinella spiralis TaxID=6334 RepID=A0A0V1B0R8_TRISP|nr:Gastric triacylglycerol lipase [Trichinella spiralis]